MFTYNLVAAAANSTIGQELGHPNMLYARDAWNQTFVDTERSRCPNPTAAQICCPGYCSWDYKSGSKPLKTCCPANYYLSFFGNGRIGYHDMECCDSSVKRCDLGSDTKKPQKPFDRPSTDVGFLQQDCEGRSGATEIKLSWKTLAIAAASSIMLIVASPWG